MRDSSGPSTPDDTPVVAVVDDDVSVRESIEMLIRCAGWQAEVFASASEFLSRPRPRPPNCLVIDMVLPDLHGLDLQKLVAEELMGTPVIFITGYGDVPTTVQAMKAGAVEFLTKPLGDEVLLRGIQRAIDRSRASITQERHIKSLRKRYASLSRRERQVMALVVRGHMNKQVGAELNISEVTVKTHRGRAMRKMGAKSLAELVNMAGKLNLEAESKP